jgi:hypothetical protein
MGGAGSAVGDGVAVSPVWAVSPELAGAVGVVTTVVPAVDPAVPA